MHRDYVFALQYKQQEAEGADRDRQGRVTCMTSFLCRNKIDNRRAHNTRAHTQKKKNQRKETPKVPPQNNFFLCVIYVQWMLSLQYLLHRGVSPPLYPKHHVKCREEEELFRSVLVWGVAILMRLSSSVVLWGLGLLRLPIHPSTSTTTVPSAWIIIAWLAPLDSR